MWPFSSAAPPAPPRADDRIRNRDILADDRAARARTRWTRVLIVYLRVLSMVCLTRGLLDWSRILGFTGPEGAFETDALTAQVTIALYAVLNCVAAVGLWLTSAWGAVLWLTATLFEILLPVAGGRPLLLYGASDVALIGLALIYVMLTWLSARERGHDR